MKVYVITADADGSPDSMQVGVADSEHSALVMLFTFLVREGEGEEDIPEVPRLLEDGCELASNLSKWRGELKDHALDYHGHHINIHSHIVNSLAPKYN